ncbi:hypothetical protein RhiJN_11940 [Ceratobasidium sp. AG-Ba]|nr:hypothetical protein RhiJN_11940 [Ceratobasidium sp. AG-Ba]
MTVPGMAAAGRSIVSKGGIHLEGDMRVEGDIHVEGDVHYDDEIIMDLHYNLDEDISPEGHVNLEVPIEVNDVVELDGRVICVMANAGFRADICFEEGNDSTILSETC